MKESKIESLLIPVDETTKQRRSVRSLDYYRKILSTNEEDASASFEVGRILASTGQAEKSFGFFETAIKSSPDTTKFWVCYIEALISVSHLSQAKKVLEQVRSKGSQSPRFEALRLHIRDTETKNEAVAIYNKALNEMDKGAFNLAIKTYSRAIEKHPSFVEAYLNLGVCQRHIGEPKSAMDTYRVGISVDSNYEVFHFNLGNLLYSEESLDEALKCYEKAIELNPTYIDALWGIGIIYHDQKKFSAAIKKFRNVLELNPLHAETHNNIANS